MLKQGDTVQLKSGSPALTIESEVKDGVTSVSCQWFDGSDAKSGTFPLASLVPYQQAPKRIHPKPKTLKII